MHRYGKFCKESSSEQFAAAEFKQGSSNHTMTSYRAYMLNQEGYAIE